MSTPTADMSFPLITLQPIANVRHGWVALSLESAGGLDATALGRIFCEFGLYDALEGLPCVVAVATVPADLGEYIPAQDIILRLPASYCADAANAATLQRLQHEGFRVIVEGEIPAGKAVPPSITGLAVHCSGGKPPASAAGWLAQLPGLHLALGVDDGATLSQCLGAKFQWFAGRYPLHPDCKTAPGNTATSSALLLKLLALVAKEAESREIEALVKQDPNLTYQLLRLVNSVAFALTQKITTFGQALQLLGRRQLQRWLQLLLYANPASNLPSPLLPRAALRAALMEALLRRCNHQGEILDHGFMAGMFSLLDVLLGVPLEKTLASLNLADDINTALLTGQGELGRILAVVIASERSPADLEGALVSAGIGSEAWAEALAQASQWALQVSREAA